MQWKIHLKHNHQYLPGLSSYVWVFWCIPSWVSKKKYIHHHQSLLHLVKSPEIVLKNGSYIIYPCHSMNVVKQLNHLKKTKGPNHLVSHDGNSCIAVVARHLKGLFMMIPLKNHLFDKSSSVESSETGLKNVAIDIFICNIYWSIQCGKANATNHPWNHQIFMACIPTMPKWELFMASTSSTKVKSSKTVQKFRNITG